VVERLNLTEDIEMLVVDDHLELRAGRKPRMDWEDAFRAMAQRGGDQLLDEPTATKWDDEEWEW